MMEFSKAERRILIIKDLEFNIEAYNPQHPLVKSRNQADFLFKFYSKIIKWTLIACLVPIIIFPAVMLFILWIRFAYVLNHLEWGSYRDEKVDAKIQQFSSIIMFNLMITLFNIVSTISLIQNLNNFMFWIYFSSCFLFGSFIWIKIVMDNLEIVNEIVSELYPYYNPSIRENQQILHEEFLAFLVLIPGIHIISIIALRKRITHNFNMILREWDQSI